MSSSQERSSTNSEGFRRMAKLLNKVISKPESEPFREPVAWRELGIFDYPKIIKKMMDLGTVKRKLEKQQYATVQECADDIRLIWENCMTYNADGSDFFILAENFSRKFEERYKKIKADCDISQDDSNKSDDKGAPTLESRVKFASDLFKLTGVELGHAIQVIDLRCPHALEKPTIGVGKQADDNVDGSIEDELEVNVDALDTRTFIELEAFVSEHIQRRLASAGSSDTKKTGKRKR